MGGEEGGGVCWGGVGWGVVKSAMKVVFEVAISLRSTSYRSRQV